jgi:hypothetical protein
MPEKTLGLHRPDHQRPSHRDMMPVGNKATGIYKIRATMPCTPTWRDCVETEQMPVMMRAAMQVRQRQRCLTDGMRCRDCAVMGQTNKQAMAGAQTPPAIACHDNGSQWDGTSDNDCNTACVSTRIRQACIS